jgi:hypothetical protein
MKKYILILVFGILANIGFSQSTVSGYTHYLKNSDTTKHQLHYDGSGLCFVYDTIQINIGDTIKIVNKNTQYHYFQYFTQNITGQAYCDPSAPLPTTLTTTLTLVNDTTVLLLTTTNLVTILNFDGGGFYQFINFLVTDTSATSIKENSNISNLTVFPNPVIDNITIAFNALKSKEKIEILNITGQVIYTETNTSIGENKIDINTTFLTPGFYFVRVGNANYKLVKT